jgi:hypothetical protein
MAMAARSIRWRCSRLGIVAGLALCAWVTPFREALPWVERPLSLVALNERARLTVERLGYGDPEADTVHGVDGSRDYFEWLREEHRDEIPERMQAGRPASVYVWHRQSPQPLVPVDLRQQGPAEDDPPQRFPGMVHVRVDPKARLLMLDVVPTDVEVAEAETGADGKSRDRASPPDWTVLFEEAGLDQARFTPVEPARTPPHYVDTRAAWEGSYAEAPDTPIRIEAGGVAGRPVWVQVFGPWSKPVINDKGK